MLSIVGIVRYLTITSHDKIMETKKRLHLICKEDKNLIFDFRSISFVEAPTFSNSTLLLVISLKSFGLKLLTLAVDTFHTKVNNIIICDYVLFARLIAMKNQT